MSPRGHSLGRIAVLVVYAILAAPALAAAHGGGDAATSQLSMQPARALAQQAHALLHIRHDAREAGVRLDAALESGDTRDVDMPTLRRAADVLDRGGDDKQVMDLIDEALSKPYGAKSGKLFHGGGREFRPARDAQQVVGIIVGGVLLALGGSLLWRTRRRHEIAGPPVRS
jgi:hypothetical protein